MQALCSSPETVPVQQPSHYGDWLAPSLSQPSGTCSDYITQTPPLELGSPECPTVGSKGHRFADCKPCAFLYTKGCANGVQCSFCHLCEPGEKKKRAKEARFARRSAVPRAGPKNALWR